MTPTVKDIANLPADKLPPLVHVPPVTRPFDVTIRPPGSKSLTNRALLLAALAEGESVLTGALADADDAQVMVRALRQLGGEIEVTPEVEANGESCGNATIRVRGVGGQWRIKAGETVTLNLNNAGTATRFLTAAAVLAPPDSGGIVIDGDARMRKRPIDELADVLNALTDPDPVAEYLGEEGFPPVRVHADRIEWRAPTHLSFGRTQSSQFISAVLLVGAFMPEGLRVCLQTEGATSRPYIEMTLAMLEAVGIRPCRDQPSDRAFVEDVRDKVGASGGGRDRTAFETISFAPIDPGWTAGRSLPGFRMAIEPDASGASYMLAAAALLPSARALVRGLPNKTRSMQGDTAFTGLLECAGAGAWSEAAGVGTAGSAMLRAVDADLSDMPDTAMTAAALAAFVLPGGGDAGVSTLRGLRTLRVKETDRVQALVAELMKVGVAVEPFAYSDRHGHPDEGIRITPPRGGIDCSPSAPRVEFDTYDDHRMAMSLALIGLRRPNVYIRDPGCVRKTYPTFWRDLAKLYG